MSHGPLVTSEKNAGGWPAAAAKDRAERLLEPPANALAALSPKTPHPPQTSGLQLRVTYYNAKFVVTVYRSQIKTKSLEHFENECTIVYI